MEGNAFDVGDWKINCFKKGENSIENVATIETKVPPVLTSSKGNECKLFLIEYYQEDKGRQYLLKNALYNVLSSLEIA